MRDGERPGPSRVQGPVKIRREVQRLLIKVARFAQHRATTPKEHLWAGKVYDRLEETLRVAESEEF